MANNSLDALFRSLSQLLIDLQGNTFDVRAVTKLVNSIGFQMPPGGSDFGLNALNFASLITKLQKVLDLEVKIDAGTGGLSVQLDAAYIDLIPAVANTLSALKNLPVAFSALPAAYLSATDVKNQFVPRVTSSLVSRYLQDGLVPFYQLLRFSGLMDQVMESTNAATFRAGNVRDVLRVDRLPKLFGDFGSIARERFGWGTPSFAPEQLIGPIVELLQSVGGDIEVHRLSQKEEEVLTGAPAPLAATQPLTAVMVYLDRMPGGSPAAAGLFVSPLRPTTPGGTDWGFAVSPFLFGGAKLTFNVRPSLTATIDSNADITSGVAALIRPTGGTLRTNLASGPAAAAAGHLLLTFEYSNGAQPISLFEISPGIGVTAQKLALSGGVDIDGGRLGAIGKVALTGGHFKIDSSQMDSFLASIIPISIDLGFDFGIGWSAANGFFFAGSASPAVTIGLHQSIGPIDLDTLHVGLDLGQGNALPLEVSVTGGASLGPFKVAVDRIGIQVVLTASDGNLGPVDLSLKFKPPNGLGMQLDAGLISGGGYLFIDQAKHRYAGVLECSIADIVQVKIIGVLDTVLPDGTPEFSLLLVITTEFPPIQLSFGFTLNGVGGVGGVNRTMCVDALRAGFRAHHLDSILFPPDPIDNAPQIISDLSSFFPAAGGRYVFGPMFELGWGTPTLITLSLGVILEIPDPIKIVILGEIQMALPTTDVALIEINIDVLGVIDFGANLLTIQGSMYDSYVLVYSLSGDMALMLAWGDNPNFAFSVGGLNPRFTPPPNFPQLNRCCVSIGDGDNPRLSANSYYAVTSNSAQFGANVDLYAAAGGFSIHGWIGYDALFIFSPFSFTIDFSAGLDVEYQGDSLCSIHVDGMLAGPRPWHVHGDASFHILFIDVSASVDLHWGDADPVTLQPVKVLPDLEKAFANPQSWSTQLPDDATLAVSLAARPGDNTLVVHPVGTLQVREKVVPLGQTITKYGNATPSDGTYFTISSVTVNTKPEAQQWLTDMFAIGQYTDLTDDQQLTSQSYQPFNSGISIGSNDVVTSRDVQCVVAYQDGYIDGDDTGMRLRQTYVLPLDIHLAYSRMGAGFVSATRTKGVSQFTVPGTTSAVTTGEVQYVIASTTDLSVRTDLLSAPVTHFEAQSALGAHLAANPADRGALQVVATYEVAA